MEPTEQLATIIPILVDIVDRMEPTDLDNPHTACANFTVTRGARPHDRVAAASLRAGVSRRGGR